YRQYPQRREGRRSASAAINQIRVRHQPSNGPSARRRGAATTARDRRRGDRMKRREFIMLLGGAAAAWPVAVRAQQPAMPVVGFFGAARAPVARQWLSAFVQGLDELGWVDGRNITIELRWAEGRGERAAEIAAEFVRFKVNIIATWSTAA